MNKQMGKIKEDCYWFKSEPRAECKILKTLQCEECGKCSFFETEAQFEKRRIDFEKRYGTPIKKLCGDCKQFKPIAEFVRCGTTKDGFYCYCRECVNKRARKRYIHKRGEKQK